MMFLGRFIGFLAGSSTNPIVQTNPNNQNPLLSLPKEIFHGEGGIFSHMPDVDKINFAATCKAAREISTNYDVLQDAKMRSAWEKHHGVPFDRSLTVEENTTKAKALESFPANLIDALGGREAVHNLPILNLGNRMGNTGYIDFLEPEDLTAPIMRGVDKYGRHFVAICYNENSENRQFFYVNTVFQRQPGINNKSDWRFAGGGELGMKISGPLVGEGGAAVFERLARLVKGEPVAAIDYVKYNHDTHEHYVDRAPRIPFQDIRYVDAFEPAIQTDTPQIYLWDPVKDCKVF